MSNWQRHWTVEVVALTAERKKPDDAAITVALGASSDDAIACKVRGEGLEDVEEFVVKFKRARR